MQFSCAQTEFSAALSLVGRAVPSRPSHPVLANVLMIADADEQIVRLRTFDLSLGIQTSFPAEVETPGTITLPAKLLIDIVTKATAGDLSLTVEDFKATLTTTSSSYEIRGMDAEEFPELPEVEGGETAKLAIASLITGLKGTLPSASNDETKQVLTGVRLTLQPGGLELASTDGHRLTVVETSDETGNQEAEVTVPAKALQELTRLLERQSGAEVTVHFDRSQAVFEWADQILTSRLLEGQYPNYRQLIPKQFSRQITVERRLLLGALERIAVLADQKNNIVVLKLDNATQLIFLSVEAQDVGNGRETLVAHVSGDDLTIAFNVKYLIDGLRAIDTTEVTLRLNTATSPAIIVLVGELKLTYLLMPIQVRKDA